MTPIQPDVAVVAGLLDRYTLDSPDALRTAQSELTAALRLSMQHTQAYGIPMAQQLPAANAPAESGAFVHPFNVAAALLTLAANSTRLGPALTVDADLQVYSGAGWQPVAGSPVPSIPVNILVPPPPPVAAPPPPPAPAIPLPPAPAGDISSLVDAAVGSLGAAPPPPQAAPPAAPAPIIAPSTVAATPQPVTQAAPPPPQQAPISTPAQLETYLTNLHAQQAAPPPPQQTPAALPLPTTAEGMPGPPQVNHVQAQAEGQQFLPAESTGLPSPDVVAGRTGESGRPQKSPFEGKVEARTKLAPAPWWWKFMRHSAKRLFTDNPAQALDPESSGSGPVQSYALLVALLQDTLRRVDGELTVAELRTYLREVETGMSALASAEAIYQLVDHLYETGK